MKATLILVAAAVAVASCSSGDDDGSASGPTAPVAVQSTFVDTTDPPARSEAPAVRIDAIVFDGDPVAVLVNGGDTPFELNGFFLCNRPSYMPIPDTTIEPGGFVEVPLGDLNVDPTDGELALYTSSEYGDPDAIVRYVQWGGDEHGRTSVAVQAGVWVDGDSVDNGGSSISATSDDPVSASGWTVG